MIKHCHSSINNVKQSTKHMINQLGLSHQPTVVSSAQMAVQGSRSSLPFSANIRGITCTRRVGPEADQREMQEDEFWKMWNDSVGNQPQKPKQSSNWYPAILQMTFQQYNLATKKGKFEFADILFLGPRARGLKPRICLFPRARGPKSDSSAPQTQHH